jgi:hypothetical protein
MSRLTTIGLVAVFGLALLPAASAANIEATATMTWAASGSNFDYTITLNNLSTSDATIGTFWFAWLPNEDFLPTPPVSFESPAGWTGQVTHFPNVDTNGFAIQWTTGATDSPDNVAIGGSKVFTFTSADTPAQLAGESPFFPGTPTTLSVVYPGGPFSDDGHNLVVQVVPEPASVALGAVGAAWMLGIAILRRRTRPTA